MNKIKFLSAALAMSILVLGCKFELPKRIKIVEDADYKLKPIANAKKDLSESLDIGKTVQGFSSNSMEVMEYTKGDNSKIQTYVAYMSLADFDVDPSKMIDDNLDLNKSFDDMTVEQIIEIPNIPAPTVSQSIDLSSIENTIKPLVNLVRGSTNTDLNLASLLSGQQAQFETVKYESGTLTIKITGKTNESITLTTRDANGTSEVFTPTTNGSGIATVDFSGKTLDLRQIRVDSAGLAFELSMSSDAKLDTVTGLTLASETQIGNVSQDLAEIPADSFEHCEVVTGSLTLGFDLKTSTNLNVTTNRTLTGALELVESDFVAGVASLAGKELKAGKKVHLEMNVKIWPSNATLKFKNDEKPAINANMSITSMNVEKKVDSQINITKNEDLPGDAAKMLSSITFAPGTGVNIKYVNTLPAGNDLVMTATSNFIGMSTPTNGTLTADPTKTTERTCTDIKIPLSHTQTVQPGDKTDFKVDVTLPGYDATKNTMTVTNVVPGAKYRLYVKPEPNIDWSEVAVDVAALQADPFADSMDTGLNPKSFLSMLDGFIPGASDKVSFKSAKLYFYASKPQAAPGQTNPFDNVQFKGKVKLEMKNALDKNSAVPTVYVLGDSTTEGDLPFSVVPRPTVIEGKNVLDTKLTGTSTEIGDLLSKYVNDPAASADPSLCADYSVYMDSPTRTITLTKADLNGSASTKITIEAYIELPLELKVDDVIEMNLGQMAGIDPASDIFQRTGPSQGTPFEMFNIKLNYECPELPVIADNIKLEIAWAENGRRIPEVKRSVAKIGKGSIGVEEGDIAKLNTYYPVSPMFNVVIDEGTIGIPKKMNFTLSADVEVVVKGEYEFEF